MLRETSSVALEKKICILGKCLSSLGWQRQLAYSSLETTSYALWIDDTNALTLDTGTKQYSEREAI